MKTPTNLTKVREILELKQSELAGLLRGRDKIAIEKCPDQIDEIQYASERDLAIRNMDSKSLLARQVKAALWRLCDGSFGTCIECDAEISPKRLAAVPWAPRCIQCQETADRDGQEHPDVNELIINAA